MLEENIEVSENYFENMEDTDFVHYGVGLLTEMRINKLPSLSWKDVCFQLSGDSKVKKLYEDKNNLVVISIDSRIRVMNFIDKHTSTIYKSVEMN